MRHVNFDTVKAVVLASPGYVKDDLRDYIFQQATTRDIKVCVAVCVPWYPMQRRAVHSHDSGSCRPIIQEIRDHKEQFLLCHASSGHRRALKEVLADPVRVTLSFVLCALSFVLCALLLFVFGFDLVLDAGLFLSLDQDVLAKLKDTKAVQEVKALETFFELMHSDPERAFYGFNVHQ